MNNLPNRSMYCLLCRKKTLSTNVKLHENKRPRGAPGIQYMLKGFCTVCGKGQAQIVPGKVGGDLNSVLNPGKLPELHLPGHNFAGPGTKLKERLLRGDTPVKELDKADQFHDMTYAIFKDKKDRHVFDKKLLDEAFNIVKNLKNSLKDRAEAGLVGSLMFGKRKLGMGVRYYS